MARKGTEAERISEAVLDAIGRHDAPALTALVHPDGEWELLTAKGKVVRGRPAIMKAFERAWRRIHDVQSARMRSLARDAVIVEGRSRYALPGGGFADAPVVWLHEIRDGALWRVRIFESVEAAEAAWAPDANGRPPGA